MWLHVVQTCYDAPSGAGSSGLERTRWVRQQEHRRRQLRQVFVRGDSVVLVSAGPSPAEAAAAAQFRPHARQRQQAAQKSGIR